MGSAATDPIVTQARARRDGRQRAADQFRHRRPYAAWHHRHRPGNRERRIHGAERRVWNGAVLVLDITGSMAGGIDDIAEKRGESAPGHPVWQCRHAAAPLGRGRTVRSHHQCWRQPRKLAGDRFASTRPNTAPKPGWAVSWQDPRRPARRSGTISMTGHQPRRWSSGNCTGRRIVLITVHDQQRGADYYVGDNDWTAATTSGSPLWATVTVGPNLDCPTAADLAGDRQQGHCRRGDQ